VRELFKLVGELSIAGVELVKGKLDDVDKSALKFAKNFERVGRSVEKAGMTLTKNITLPLAAIGTSLLYVAQKTADYSERILNLEQSTGLSGKALQEFKYICDRLGVSFEGLTTGIQQFSKKLPAIAKEGGPAYDAIKKLGVNIFDASGNVKKMDELFPEFIKKLQAIENVTQRNSIAQQIFSKTIGDLAPILGMTAEEFDGLRSKATELGGVMSEDALKAADAYGDQVGDLKVQFESFGRQLASKIIPILQGQIVPLVRDTIMPLFEKLISLIRDTATWFNNLSDSSKKFYGILLLFAVGIGPVLTGFGQLLFAVKALIPVISLLSAALTSLPFLLIVAGPLAFTGIIKGMTKAYYDNIEAHKKWKVETADQATVDAFILKYKILIDLINNYSGALRKDGSNATNLFGKELNELLTIARSLNYVIEGDLNQQIKQLGNLASALGGQLNLSTGAIFQFEKGVKASNDTSKEKIKTTKEEIKLQSEWTAKILQQNIEQSKSEEEKYSLKLKLNELERTKSIAAERERFEESKKKILAGNEELEAAKLISEENARLLQEESKINQYYTNEKTALAEEYKNKTIELNADETKSLLEKYDKEKDALDEIQAKKDADLKKKEDYERQTTFTIFSQLAARVAATKKAYEEEKKAAEEAEADITNIRAGYQQEQLQGVLAFVEAVANYTSNIVNKVFDLYAQDNQNKMMLLEQQTQMQTDALDKQIQNEIAAVNASTMSAKQKATAIAALEKKKADEIAKINEESDKKSLELRRKQAKRDKAQAIFSAIINTAVGIVSAIANSGNPILGIVMAAIVAALGIAQIAIIAAQPMPMAKGAFVKKRKGGVEAVIGEGDQDEAVLPVDSGAQIIADKISENTPESESDTDTDTKQSWIKSITGAIVDGISRISMPVIEQIKSIAAPEEFMPQMAMEAPVYNRGGSYQYPTEAPEPVKASTGGATTSYRSVTEPQVHLHVGTLIADDSGLKQLERMLLKFRVEDTQRLGVV
jgi:hypothetical protein